MESIKNIDKIKSFTGAKEYEKLQKAAESLAKHKNITFNILQIEWEKYYSKRRSEVEIRSIPKLLIEVRQGKSLRSGQLGKNELKDIAFEFFHKNMFDKNDVGQKPSFKFIPIGY